MLWQSFVIICSFNSLLVVVESKLHKYELDSMKNSSEMAIALSKVVESLERLSPTVIFSAHDNSTEFNEFVMALHRIPLLTCVFDELELFFDFIEYQLSNSSQVTAFIFHHPSGLVERIHEKNLAHRLCLFIFYWNACELPATTLDLREPLRTIMITRPERSIFDVFYNQVSSSDRGIMELVNRYDGDNLGWQNDTRLATKVENNYENLNQRLMVVPVTHNPPWISINPSRSGNSRDDVHPRSNVNNDSSHFDEIPGHQIGQFTVSGRDDVLLKILAKQMNFTFRYVDVSRELLQLHANDTQPAQLGLKMIIERKASIFFGDVVATNEMLQQVDFSFFTLPDSGAFLTHAPGRLSEVFALLYPFHPNVYPSLVVTIVTVGPILYLLIAVHERATVVKKKGRGKKRWAKPKQRKGVSSPDSFHDIIYIREMYRGVPEHHRHHRHHAGRRCGSQLGRRHAATFKFQRRNNAKTMESTTRKLSSSSEGLLSRCVWFTCHIFLRQSSNFSTTSHSSRLFTIILWLFTLVLSDLYSAQLTSQLARPSKERAVSSLIQLEKAVNESTRENFALLVERNSASHNVLRNGTGVMHRLYVKMISQQSASNQSYLLNSVEDGVLKILARERATAVFGGRETLYFNMKKFGIRNFHLSEKLFTRYSGISLQKGCLFLDKLNENVMKLFEGGILDKITNDEFEKMYQKTSQSSSIPTGGEQQATSKDEEKETKSESTTSKDSSRAVTGAREDHTTLNLRMLQGSFYLVLFGHLIALLVLLGEIECHSSPLRSVERTRRALGRVGAVIGGGFVQLMGIVKSFELFTFTANTSIHHRPSLLEFIFFPFLISAYTIAAYSLYKIFDKSLRLAAPNLPRFRH